MNIVAVILVGLAALAFTITLFWGAKQFFEMDMKFPGIMFLAMGAIAAVGFGYAFIKAVSG